MEFGIGDVVRVKSGKFVGTIGIVREEYENLWNSEMMYEIEVPESVIINQTILETGVRINSISMEYKNLELVLNKDMRSTKEGEQLLTALINQRAKNKYNTWEVRIRPSDDDKDFTCAELYVNGRFENREFVKHYHEDEYNVGTACVEVCKKLFGVENAEEKSEEIPTPKWFNGKVVCVKGNLSFTTGRIYDVVDGALIDNVGDKICYFTDVNDMNSKMKAQFIEVI